MKTLNYLAQAPAVAATLSRVHILNKKVRVRGSNGQNISILLLEHRGVRKLGRVVNPFLEDLK